MDRLPVAVVGSGFWATTYVLPHLSRLTTVELVAICSRHLESASRVAELFGIPRAFASLDRMLAAVNCPAAFICTPHGQHAPNALALLREGSNLFVAKPMTVTVKEARQLVCAADGRGAVLRVGFSRRFWPALNRIRSAIRSPGTSQVRRVRILHRGRDAAWAYRGQPPPESVRLLTGCTDPVEPNFRSWPAREGGGVLHDMGSHLVDQLMWLTSSRVRSVRCWGLSGSAACGIERCTIQARLECGVEAILEIDVGFEGEPLDDCMVETTTARLSAEGKHLLQVNGQPESPLVDVERLGPIEEFVQTLRCGTRGVGATGIEGLEVVRVVAACHLSAASNGNEVNMAGID